MLQPFIHVLNAQRIILASSSPRRKEILGNMDLKFEVIPSTFEENLDKSKFSSPQEYVKETARCKVEEVAMRLSKDKMYPDLLIGADTIVCRDSQIIEKPNDKEHAISILSSLSDRSHQVFTAVILACPAGTRAALSDKTMAGGLYNYTSFVESTTVFMAKLSSEVIECYVDTGEPMDKAGGYGIQKLGGNLIERIEGDYFNVMGFPLARFSKELTKIYFENQS